MHRGLNYLHYPSVPVIKTVSCSVPVGIAITYAGSNQCFFSMCYERGLSSTSTTRGCHHRVLLAGHGISYHCWLLRWQRSHESARPVGRANHAWLLGTACLLHSCFPQALQSWRVRMLYAGAVAPSLLSPHKPLPMLLCSSVEYAPGPGTAAGEASWLMNVAKPFRSSSPCVGGVRPRCSSRILASSTCFFAASSARSFVRLRCNSFCAARILASAA
eukprot:COSAG02_NODE_6319_length_3652_cov_3.466366_3_plen_217_part_00